MNVKEILNSILTEYKGKPVVTTEATTFDELDFDSLDKVDLIMQIEEKFDISFGDDTAVNTVGELVQKIESLQKK